ncbi:MAG TPA: phenylalanine--tRNA ligase subunit alpha [Candidatus Paceibacterota bacterium]|nr:phenylalanine--tRNA ligase subunit alpha [Candidatus Paceibacterota bacterium]
MEPQSTPRGHIHPISSLIREANRIFFDMGFTLVEGPLLESEWYNFDALNVPKDHPSRDMQDTFFLETQINAEHSQIDADKNTPALLRTHTSPVQVRYMEAQIKKGVKPPYRVIVPGKVFRNEATDMTHEAEFFQIEGLAVGEDITLAHLKGTLERFLKAVFKGSSAEIRFRPSFFPFTEPSVEVDVRLVGDNAPEKLRGEWIEMMGAGMVHPSVLKNVGVDSGKYQGFAFGFGIDRLAMLKWGIDDIRLMHSADLRFINQF